MAVQTIESDQFYIGGDWVAPSGPERLEVNSASTEELIGSVPLSTNADIDTAVGAARQAFDDSSGWSSLTPDERADAIDRLAAAMEKRGEEIARRVSMQNGMPITISTMLEANFAPAILRYYGSLARSYEFDDYRDGMLGGKILVQRRPIGVVGGIVPWNYPVTLAMMKLGPLLAAGCTVVLKPSPETPLDSLLLAEAATEAGIPPGVINIVPGGREVGAYLVEHPGVDKVAFTGSTPAGRAIAERCGALLRPVTLELGGKSAAIILDDADIASNVESLFGATLLNNGQTCFVSTRVLAPRNRYDEVLQVLGGLASGVQVGDPLDTATQIGPMATKAQRERVEGYIAKGKAEGARVIAGGTPAQQDRGWFVTPTVFADVENSSTIAREEIFGPVLAVMPYESEQQAIELANESEFGLGGTVWTNDQNRGEAVARRVQTGTIGINHYLPDPAAPFGGVKQSGIGRELGPEGLASYLSNTSVYLTPGPSNAG